MRSLHPPDAEHKGFGHSPTSVLNLDFEKSDSKIASWHQAALLAIETYLQFLPLLILQFGRGKMAVFAKKNRKKPRLNLHSCRDPSYSLAEQGIQIDFSGLVL